MLSAFTERLQEARRAGVAGRRDLLRALCTVPGVYCPGLYEVRYESPAGAILGVRPAEPGVPPVVHKATYRGTTLASSTVVRAGGRRLALVPAAAAAAAAAAVRPPSPPSPPARR